MSSKIHCVRSAHVLFARVLSAGIFLAFAPPTLHAALPNSATTASIPASAASAPHATAAKPGTVTRAAVQIPKQPNNTDAKADDDRHHLWEIDNARQTFWLGIAMACIAIFQLALFAVQLRMMQRNISDTASAAKAAELNAKAAIGLELPFIRAFPSDLLGMDQPIPAEGPYGGYVNDGPPVAHNALGPIQISNLGRTPAYSLTVSFGWMVTQALPDNPPAFRRKIRMNHNVVLAAGAETNLDSDLYIALSEEDVKAAEQEEKWLWIFGEIEFHDFMDQRQIARFCWRFANRNPPDMQKLFYLSSDGDPPIAYTLRTSTIDI